MGVVLVGQHRRTGPSVVMLSHVGRALRRNSWMMATANSVTAAALLFGEPGSSPTLAFIAVPAPLPLWGAAFAAAAAFQLAGKALVGHSIAAFLWAFLAIGAVVGLVAGTSTAPAASVILAGLTIYAAGHHVNAMDFRRREREAARRDR